MAKKKLLNMVILSALVLTGQIACLPTFADGPVDISIVEVIDDNTKELWSDITGAMPGERYDAIPRVENNGSATVTVQMCLSGSVVNSVGETIDLPTNAFGIEIGEEWTLDSENVVNPTDPASGNCYKYNLVLEPSSITEPLFREVSLSPAFANEHQGATFSLHLDAFAKESYPDNPDEPVDPGGSDVPVSPDTGTATAEVSGAALVIPYVLGVAALMVLMIHLVGELFWEKIKTRGKK